MKNGTETLKISNLVELTNNLPKELFGLTPSEAKQQGICISCKQKIYFRSAKKAEKAGHIYSFAGQNEYRMTALCEYCFDKAFDVPDDYEIDPDQWEVEEAESFTENK